MPPKPLKRRLMRWCTGSASRTWGAAGQLNIEKSHDRATHSGNVAMGTVVKQKAGPGSTLDLRLVRWPKIMRLRALDLYRPPLPGRCEHGVS